MANGADEARVFSCDEQRRRIEGDAVPNLVRERRERLIHSAPLVDEQGKLEKEVPLLRRKLVNVIHATSANRHLLSVGTTR